jgi:hypothetical protein
MKVTVLAGCTTFFAAALNAQSLDCAALQNSFLPEPAGYSEQCGSAITPNPRTVLSTNAPTDTAFTVDIRGNAAAAPPRAANTLYSFTLNAFQTQTARGTTNASMFATDFSADTNTLFGVIGAAAATNALNLGTVNRTTGAFTPIAAITGLTAGDGPSGLAINPRTNAAFLAAVGGTPATSRLYSLNLTTAAATLIGPITAPTDAAGTLMIAIAMNCEGQLFAHNLSDDALYSVNTTTGAGTLIGTHGLAANFAQGMDFDNSDGRLYGFIYTGTGTNRFGTFNLSTGAFTTLSQDNPLGEYEGAIPTACPLLATITPVTPPGTLNVTSGSVALNFSNGAAAGGPSGTVSCALSNTTGTISIAPTAPITVAAGATGGFVVSGSGAPGSTYTGTVTCAIQGGAPVVYTINGTVSAVTQINTLGTLGLTLLGFALIGFGAFAARRFS